MTDSASSLSVLTAYAAGSPVSLNLQSTGDALTAYIDHTFLPFTKSQTLKVHFAPSSAYGLPRQAILKVFDRRYINDRTPRHYEAKPWSREREDAAQARWLQIKSGKVVDDARDIMIMTGPFAGTINRPSEEGSDEEDDPRASDPAYEEEGFRLMCEVCDIPNPHGYLRLC